MTKTDLQPYSKADLVAARNKAQVVGWAQGAGAVVLLGVVFNVVGLIPTLLVLGAGGYLVYKLLSK